MEIPGRRARHVQDDTRVSSRLRNGLNRYVATVPVRLTRESRPVPADGDSGDPDRPVVMQLAAMAFDARRKALEGSARDVVSTPAVPVLYFGDREAYTSSRLRIITVGLSPSKVEFPSDDPFARFPLAAGVDGPGEAYLAALDTYFKTNPDAGWFSSYEALLKGLEASYYPGAENTALHTGLCSPVATEPPWSRIGSEARTGLIDDGVPIWHRLVETLKPDIIVISVARAYLTRIEFESGEPFEIAHVEEEGRSRPYVTEGRWADVGGSHRSLMIFGKAAYRPFGLVSHMHKTEIGGRIAVYSRDVTG